MAISVLCNSVFSSLTSIDIFSLFFVVMASTLIVFAILTPATTASIIALYRKGVDPSGFVALVVTGVGDALTPLTLILVSQIHHSFPMILKLVLLVAVLALRAASYYYLIIFLQLLLQREVA